MSLDCVKFAAGGRENAIVKNGAITSSVERSVRLPSNSFMGMYIQTIKKKGRIAILIPPPEKKIASKIK